MRKQLIVSLLLVVGIILGACGSKDENVIEVGTQDYTDPKIMGQIIKLLIENETDYTVNVTEDIQASPQIINALDQGEFDVATLYSGEVYNNHFDDDKVEFSTDPEKTMEQAQNLFKEKFNFKWYDSIGFNNQYSVAVTREFAEENNVETMSDLGKFADSIILGTDSAWKERANDGYEAYTEAYGYEFSDVRGMEISLMYVGIENDELDAITAYTVDPQIIEQDLVLLEDDKDFFAPYDASLVARGELVEENQAVSDVLDSIVGLISTEEMTELIREVEINERNTTEVAEEFLKEKGMLD